MCRKWYLTNSRIQNFAGKHIPFGAKFSLNPILATPVLKNTRISRYTTEQKQYLERKLTTRAPRLTIRIYMKTLCIRKHDICRTVFQRKSKQKGVAGREQKGKTSLNRVLHLHFSHKLNATHTYQKNQILFNIVPCCKFFCRARCTVSN